MYAQSNTQPNFPEEFDNLIPQADAQIDGDDDDDDMIMTMKSRYEVLPQKF